MTEHDHRSADSRDEVNHVIEDATRSADAWPAGGLADADVVSGLVAQLSSRDRHCAELRQRLDELEQRLRALDGGFQGLVSDLADREQVILDHEQTITDREQVILDHEQTISDREQSILELQAQNCALRKGTEVPERERRQLMADAEARLEKQRSANATATRDFDRLAGSRLARLSFALSSTAAALLQAAGEPTRLTHLLRDLVKEAALRLANRPIRGVVDSPDAGQTVIDALEVSGWAYSGSAPIESVSALLAGGGTPVNALEYGLERPDVVDGMPWSLSARCGFIGVVPLADVEPGEHAITVQIRDRAGHALEIKRSFVVGGQAEAYLSLAGAGQGETAGGAHPGGSAAEDDAELANRRPHQAPPRGPASQVGDPNPPDALAKTMLRAFLNSEEHLTFPMHENPAVSIIIPTFKQAHYVYLTLESILANTRDLTYEVVIVDNASEDETETLLNRLKNVQVRFNESNLGFARACNQGAEMARGRYICFLNSDALPTAGWLAALVQTMESYPDCGAVGGKLVYPSGRLQEAGSVIWRDGSTAGYGRAADPLDPQYCYVREVDYCSAACLLMRRDLFSRLNGFDERYQPAYCEDSDLCLAVWAAGYRVVYQPRCVVLHIEGGSSRSEQAIALQRLNREKLVAKWQSTLSAHLPANEGNMLIARDRRRGRRVLVVDDYLPNAGLGQGMPRAVAMVRCLVDLGYVVSFLPVQSNRFGAAANHLQQLGVEVLTGGAATSAELSAWAGLFEAAIVSRPHNAELIPLIRKANPSAAVVYDAEAVFALRSVREAECEGHPMPPEDAEALIRSEVSPIDGADVVLTVSSHLEPNPSQSLSGP